MKQYREDPGICVEDKYIVQNLCISCDESLNVLDPMIVKEVIFVFDMFFFRGFDISTTYAIENATLQVNRASDEAMQRRNICASLQSWKFTHMH